MSPRCFGKIRRCSIFHASRTATASMAAGTIVLAGSQRLENTLDPVDFQHNVQCAGFRFYMPRWTSPLGSWARCPRVDRAAARTHLQTLSVWINLEPAWFSKFSMIAHPATPPRLSHLSCWPWATAFSLGSSLLFLLVALEQRYYRFNPACLLDLCPQSAVFQPAHHLLHFLLSPPLPSSCYSGLCVSHCNAQRSTLTPSLHLSCQLHGLSESMYA